jgi:hypothetical protein
MWHSTKMGRQPGLTPRITIMNKAMEPRIMDGYLRRRHTHSFFLAILETRGLVLIPNYYGYDRYFLNVMYDYIIRSQ